MYIYCMYLSKRAYIIKIMNEMRKRNSKSSYNIIYIYLFNKNRKLFNERETKKKKILS